MSKQSAIDLVNKFKSQGGPSAWPNVNRAALADGLIERINNPNMINQRGTPLCGPASFVRAVATDNPDGYAQAAIDLFTRGTTKLGSLDIRPGTELKQSSPQGNTNAADWVMLGSVRDSANWFLSLAGWLGGSFAGVTRAATMEQWFRDTGYTKIVNITYYALKPIPSVLAVEAHRASKYFSRGYKVVLLIDMDMLDADSQDDLVSMYPDHWVALNSTIRDGGITSYDAPVSFNVYSWGSPVSVPVRASKPLLKRDFLHKYYGFIAAGR
ncbi:MAG TPA: hypothetical protein VJH03_24040 [Blastocatellia bacterium]|nr:hypothetical protein [Blastocatellia bacterium]